MKSFLLIDKQTEAEKDSQLLDCFYDSGAIDELVKSSYTVLTGRKGAGKSAIARYLEKKHDDFGVDYVIRLSVRNFNLKSDGQSKDILESMLVFIAIKTAKKLLDNKLLKKSAEEFWSDFFTTNGLNGISDYESFIATKKTTKRTINFRAAFSLFAKAEGGVDGEDGKESGRTVIAATSGNLFDSLTQSLPEDKYYLIFVDDISDYLDESDSKNIKRDINIIQDLLLKMQTFNLDLADAGLKSRFISLVRDDLFDFMEGSNTGKIKSDSLPLEWCEKDFARLIINRMAVLQDDLEASLEDPIAKLKEWFPDNIFSDLLKNFDTNRYESNFYAYMAAVSFNRPRDFLKFCYALRDRLSSDHPATKENIESAEIEYTDYLELELRNELFIASKVFDYDLSHTRVNYLIRIMTKKDVFSYSELRTELGKFFKENKVGHKKVEQLLDELWRYGVIGVKEKEDLIIRFRYLYSSAIFSKDRFKDYKFYLHRGLWWFAKKNLGSK